MPNKLLVLLETFWLFCCWFGGALLGAMLMQLTASAFGIGNWQNLISEIKAGAALEHINTIKIISIVGHLSAYSLPALVFALIIKGKKFHSLLLLDKNPGFRNIPLIIIAILCVYPAVLWIAYLNINLLPAHMIAKDTLIFEQRLMQMNSPTDLLLNIVLLGLVAGVGEELLYRGAIQQLFARFGRNIHLAVWATALLFSITHFQPEGLIPRMLMGAFLGYLCFWTGSLWSSIIAHISFNSVQVLIFYYVVDAEKLSSIYQKPDFSFLLTIILIGIFIFVSFLIWKINKGRQLKLGID
jgi:membrane protease YdiL (CAAX protease family)